MADALYESNESSWLNAPDDKGKALIRQPYLRSTDLFGGAREVVIEHAGQEYRLRLTRQGKLILTK